MDGPSIGQLDGDVDEQLAKLVGELLDEVKALRVGNARLIEQLDLEGDGARRIGVQDGDRHRLLKASEVAYITPDDDELTIYTTDGKRHVNTLGLNEVQERFAGDLRMLRVHKSYIINLDQVRVIGNSGNGRVVTFYGFPDETTVPVSWENIQELERRLGVTTDARS